jgi:hypothetical protein
MRVADLSCEVIANNMAGQKREVVLMDDLLMDDVRAPFCPRSRLLPPKMR